MGKLVGSVCGRGVHIYTSFRLCHGLVEIGEMRRKPKNFLDWAIIQAIILLIWIY